MRLRAAAIAAALALPASAVLAQSDENLSLDPLTNAGASSQFSNAYRAELAIDGTNAQDSSWCTASSDPAPVLRVILQQNARVSRVRLRTAFSPNYDFHTGRFRFLDAAGNVVHETGVVTLSSGEIDLPISPPVTPVRRAEFVGVTWQGSGPCIGEFEVFGVFEPCVSASDCSNGLFCDGVETCDFGRCRPASATCGLEQYCDEIGGACLDNYSRLPGTGATASSEFGPGYRATNVIDGVDSGGSSWCTANNDPQPEIRVLLPRNVDALRLRLLTAWSPTYDFLTGTFRFYDADDNLIRDTGVQTLTTGEIDLPLQPPVAGARRATFSGVTWRSIEPCLSEFEVLGAELQCDPGVEDADLDGIGDGCDNCVAQPNADQSNSDLNVGLQARGGQASATSVFGAHAAPLANDGGTLQDTSPGGSPQAWIGASASGADTLMIRLNPARRTNRLRFMLWSASSWADPDSQPSTYAVEYSSDATPQVNGGNWFPVAGLEVTNTDGTVDPLLAQVSGNTLGNWRTDPQHRWVDHKFRSVNATAVRLRILSKVAGATHGPALTEVQVLEWSSGDAGDACDTCTDTDADGYGDPGFAASTCSFDNCPAVANPSQQDTDRDGSGNSCDTDDDNDGLLDANDNCPLAANVDQADQDGDGSGDACDPCTDADGDTWGAAGTPSFGCHGNDCDDDDPDVNPGAVEVCDGVDNDCNGIPDEGDAGGGSPCSTGLLGVCAAGTLLCDGGELVCLANLGPGPELCNALDDDCDGTVDDAADSDGDGFDNCNDNCVDAANANQADADGDDVGDVCDCRPNDPANPPPPPIGATLSVARQPDNSTVVSWVAAPGEPYNAYRGWQITGDPFAFNQQCLENRSSDTSAVDTLVPRSGVAYFYLASVTCGSNAESSLGDTSAGSPRPNPDPCPAATRDRDGDGWEEAQDNCPGFRNDSQSDADTDSRGDVCDNCPSAANIDQSDIDGDTLGDVCDPDQDGDGILDDGNGDGQRGNVPCTGGATANCDDNCPRTVNPNRADADNDGIGNACEP
ncbi:MAG: thrombospondin type 3 repeat-containing protein [Acidobacteria bacterium]|nr:thrombospondin type 3 repeat-containing protein [Acidobacteriota bacterium]